MVGKWNGLKGLFEAAAPKLGGPAAVPRPRPAPRRAKADLSGYDEPRKIKPGSMEDYDTPRYIPPRKNGAARPAQKVDPNADPLMPVLDPREAINHRKMGMLAPYSPPPIQVRAGFSRASAPVIEPNATARHPLKNRLQNIDTEETTYHKRNGTSSLPDNKPGLVVVPDTKVIDPYVSGRDQLKARRAAAWNEQGHVYGPNQAHFAATGFGGAGGVTAGALIGGTTAYMGSTQENRGFGTFMKGAAFGAGAGAVVSGIASRGMISGGAEWANQVAKKFEFGEGFTENAISVTRGMETAQARGALFAAGAMLGGGMFGTNRNRAQGLNSTRGNRFGG